MEFDIINRYFRARRTDRTDVLLGIGDDCALLIPPPDQILAMSVDSLVANVHYEREADPESIGHKSLSVSLSDLAAMGALPAWVMLSLNLEKIDEGWLSKFCHGFFNLMEQYNVSLIGGNMSSGFPSVTTQVTGFLPKGKGLRRAGAKVGDGIYVTGYLGEAALGLYLRKKYLPLNEDWALLALYKALDFPQPRVEVGLAIRDIATAAIDISDGLIADLGHILQQSKVGATIHIDNILLSPAIQTVMSSIPGKPFNVIMNLILSGGDDYELCFTVPPEHEIELQCIFELLNCTYTRIGVIEAATGMQILYEGKPFCAENKGYQHFSSDF